MPRLLEAVTRRLRVNPSTPSVHFHQGSEGQPAVCYDAHCPSPRLDV